MFCHKCYKEKDEEAKYENKEGFVLGSRANGEPIWQYVDSFICEECFNKKMKWWNDCQKLAPMD